MSQRLELKWIWQHKKAKVERKLVWDLNNLHILPENSAEEGPIPGETAAWVVRLWEYTQKVAAFSP